MYIHLCVLYKTTLVKLLSKSVIGSAVQPRKIDMF